MRKVLLGSFSALLVSILSLASCIESLKDDCDNTRTCADTSSGGSGTGGGAGSSSGGTGEGGSTGGQSSACADECTSPNGVCDEEAKKCVECLKDSDCTDGVCDESTKACVECVEPEDCGDPTKPLCEDKVCTGCGAPADCTALGLAQCLPSGACVACTSEADCDGKVCDPETNTCTTLVAHELDVCVACEHDAQCQVGQVCVEMKYNDPAEGVVGNFCQWRKDAELPGPSGTCGLSSRPFASQLDVTSVDGQDATICTLGTSTCPALLQFRKTVSGCVNAFADDAACGDPDFNDGRCRLNGASQPKCTYPCVEDADCPVGTCTAAINGVCSL